MAEGKRGRPKKFERIHQVTIYVEPAMLSQLDLLADRQRTTRVEVIRQALEEYISRRLSSHKELP